ncbi:MAG TPA: cytochrome c [Terriglobia bacterium]|nr:cytochrome c [Terriglobia bacterium]
MKTRILWLLLIAGLTIKSVPAQGSHDASTQSTKAAAAPHNYNISSTQKERKNPVRFSDASAERGKKVFSNRCVLCHGPDADGKGSLAVVIGVKPPDFNKPEVLSARTDGELFVIIGSGSENMPGKSLTRLTTQQRWDIVNYLRVVGGKTPAKVTK